MARKKSRRRKVRQDDEYLDIETDYSSRTDRWGEHFSGFAGHVLDILKLLAGICLLPFLYAVCVSFVFELSRVNYSLRIDFWTGMIAFLVLYLFIWEPTTVYAKGQKIFGASFSFFKPFVRIAPALIPIYTVLVFALYAILALLIQSVWLQRYLLFLSGFTITLHLVFVSRQHRARKYDFLKANYVFGFAVTCVLNGILLAGLLSLAFRQFSFINFMTTAGEYTRHIWSSLLMF